MAAGAARRAPSSRSTSPSTAAPPAHHQELLWRVWGLRGGVEQRVVTPTKPLSFCRHARERERERLSLARAGDDDLFGDRSGDLSPTPQPAPRLSHERCASLFAEDAEQQVLEDSRGGKAARDEGCEEQPLVELPFHAPRVGLSASNHSMCDSTFGVF